MKHLSLKFSQHLKVRGYLEKIKEKVSVRHQLCLQTIGSYTYTKAFCHNVPRGDKKIKTNIDGTLESDTQLALTENNFYKTSDHLLRKGKIS